MPIDIPKIEPLRTLFERREGGFSAKRKKGDEEFNSSLFSRR